MHAPLPTPLRCLCPCFSILCKYPHCIDICLGWLCQLMGRRQEVSSEGRTVRWPYGPPAAFLGARGAADSATASPLETAATSWRSVIPRSGLQPSLFAVLCLSAEAQPASQPASHEEPAAGPRGTVQPKLAACHEQRSHGACSGAAAGRHASPLAGDLCRCQHGARRSRRRAAAGRSDGLPLLVPARHACHCAMTSAELSAW